MRKEETSHLVINVLNVAAKKFTELHELVANVTKRATQLIQE
jgi:hypothetical protein